MKSGEESRAEAYEADPFSALEVESFSFNRFMPNNVQGTPGMEQSEEWRDDTSPAVITPSKCLFL